MRERWREEQREEGGREKWSELERDSRKGRKESQGGNIRPFCVTICMTHEPLVCVSICMTHEGRKGEGRGG